MKILCGGPVSEDAPVFEAHIESLKAQAIGMDYKGIDNSPTPLTPPTGFAHVDWRLEPSLGEYKQLPVRWSKQRLRLLRRLREEMRQAALDGGYDYLFMVDSDLILGPDTLSLLLQAHKDFIAGIFWTRFRPGSKRFWVNAWHLQDGHHVEFSMAERMKLRSGIHEVDITGGCSLLSRRALTALSYATRPGISSEDICLALSAKEAGIPLFLHCDTKIEPRRRR